MARPSIFVSSTYYDLKHIRQGLDLFIKQLGYAPILFENGNIPFVHDKPLDESCYNEIKSCHVFVLIIGGRFGSSTSADVKPTAKDAREKQYENYNSITKKEYETAIELDKPVYIFVEKGVAAEFETYKGNRDNTTIKWRHVDSINIFRLLESISSQYRNNLMHEFDELTDITSWLRDQWAGLFAEYLSQKSTYRQIASMSSQLARLEGVAEALITYSEALVRKAEPEKAEAIIKETDAHLKTSIEAAANIWKSDYEKIIAEALKSSDVRKKIIDDAIKLSTIGRDIKIK